MEKTQIKVPKGFTIDAYLIKEYLTLEIGLEQETWLHQILLSTFYLMKQMNIGSLLLLTFLQNIVLYLIKLLIRYST